MIKPDDTMRPNSPRGLTSLRQLCAVALTSLALAACATRNEPPMAAGLSGDDDGYCQAHGGPAGSQAYVACRKERDVARSDAMTRADKKQHDLAEWMLNHPN